MKPRRMPCRSLVLVGLASIAGAAGAAEFNQVQTAKSHITFAYQQMGVAVTGGFGKFDARVAFDPARASAATTNIAIDLASIDAGSAEANDAVQDKDWFDSRTYPVARFTSNGVRALGGNRYEAVGKLTIKGRSHDLTAPFTFTQSAGTGVFDGQFTIRRLDYAVGEGMWADVGTVANEVQIKFHIQAGGAPAGK